MKKIKKKYGKNIPGHRDFDDKGNDLNTPIKNPNPGEGFDWAKKFKRNPKTEPNVS